MIITKKQLKKRIEESERIPPVIRKLVLKEITAKRRLMWETELVRWEKRYMNCRTSAAPASGKTIHHDCETHNTDHAV